MIKKTKHLNTEHLNDSLPPALVLGADIHGLALMRSLGRRGIPVEVADTKQNKFYRYSKYCCAFYQVSSLDDESLLEFLVNQGKRSERKKILYITKDKTVSIISKGRSLLDKYYYFNLPDDETINLLMDKHLLSKFLECNDGLVPKTIRIQNIEDIYSAVKEIKFPIILKPTLRNYRFKAFKIDSSEELIAIYKKFSQCATEFIVQEWIEGPDSEVYFCFVYADSKGKFKSTFVGKKLRQLPKITGIATAAIGCCNDYILEETKRLFKLSNYRGFGSSEFKRDRKSGSYKLIEFTVGRTDYNIETAVKNQVDLPYIGYCDLAGISLLNCHSIQNNSVCWIDFSRDMKAIGEDFIQGEINIINILRNIIRNFGTNTAYSFFATDDLKPILFFVLNRMFSIFKKINIFST